MTNEEQLARELYRAYSVYMLRNRNVVEPRWEVLDSDLRSWFRNMASSLLKRG